MNSGCHLCYLPGRCCICAPQPCCATTPYGRSLCSHPTGKGLTCLFFVLIRLRRHGTASALSGCSPFRLADHNTKNLLQLLASRIFDSEGALPPFPRPFWNRRGFMHQQNKIDSKRQIGTLTAFCYKVKVSSAFLDLVLKRQGDRLGHSENLFALFSAFRGSRLSIAEDSL